jgi:hypothetical protein
VASRTLFRNAHSTVLNGSRCGRPSFSPKPIAVVAPVPSCAGMVIEVIEANAFAPATVPAVSTVKAGKVSVMVFPAMSLPVITT